MSQWSSVVWPPPTSHPASSWISLLQLIPFVTTDVDRLPCEISPVPSSTFTTSRSPYAGGFFAVVYSGSSPLPWPSPSLIGSAPSCSPFGANISTLPCEALLRHSLYVTGCCFAPSSQRDTTLRHSQSSSCTGCLLPGHLTVTRIGLSSWLILMQPSPRAETSRLLFQVYAFAFSELLSLR